MLCFDCTQAQYNALSGLAFRIADNSYMIERYGRPAVSNELKENHNTIIGLFSDLDRLGVPFWVQNTVICWAEDWRRFKSGSMLSAFEKFRRLPDDFFISFDRVSCY